MNGIDAWGLVRLCLVAVCGCAGAAPRTSVASVHPTTAVPPPPAPEPDAEVRLVGLGGHAERVHGGPAGPARFLMGGHRVEMDATGQHEAQQVVLGALAAAVWLGDRWVFVSESGDVATSERFLGTLRVIGQTANRPGVSSATRGRCGVATDAGLFVTDGREVVRAGSTATPAREAAFADVRTGAAVLMDGSVAMTRDGGASWSPVDLGPDAALGVALQGESLTLLTTRGALTLSAQGQLAPAPAQPPETESRTDDARPTDTEAESRRAHHETMPLRDGGSLRIEAEVLVHRGPDGTVLSRTRLEDHCTLRRWGTAVAIRCTSSLMRTEDGETLQPVIGPAGHRAWAWIDPLTLLDDGRHAVFDGDCTRSPERDRDGTLCVLGDGVGTWHTLHLGGDAWRFEGMTGQWILANRCDEEGCEAKLIDADGQGEQPVTLGASAEPITARSRLRVTADGTLVGMGVSAAPRPGARRPRWLLSGPPGAPLGVTSMPDRAAQVRFVDRLRGIAVGRRIRELDRTVDGGETWEPVEVPADGLDDVEWPRDFEPTCDAEGCLVGGVIELRGWGALRASGPRALALVHRDAATRPTQTRVVPTLLRCTATEHPTPTRSRLGTDRGSNLLAWPTGLARVHAPGRDEPPRTAQFWWRTDGSPPASASLTITDETEGLAEGEPLGATRASLWWIRSGGLWRVSGGRAQDVLQAVPEALRSRLLLDNPMALPTEDGGLVVLAPFIGATSVTTALAFSPAGGLVGYRVVPQAYVPQGLARVRGRWALATMASEGTVQIMPLGTGITERLGAITGRIPVCGAGAARDAQTVTFASQSNGASVVRFDGASPRVAWVELEVSPTGVCLRGLRGVLDLQRVPGTLALRAQGGRLEGPWISDVARSAVRCEVAP